MERGSKKLGMVCAQQGFARRLGPNVGDRGGRQSLPACVAGAGGCKRSGQCESRGKPDCACEKNCNVFAQEDLEGKRLLEAVRLNVPMQGFLNRVFAGEGRMRNIIQETLDSPVDEPVVTTQGFSWRSTPNDPMISVISFQVVRREQEDGS